MDRMSSCTFYTHAYIKVVPFRSFTESRQRSMFDLDFAVQDAHYWILFEYSKNVFIYIWRNLLKSCLLSCCMMLLLLVKIYLGLLQLPFLKLILLKRCNWIKTKDVLFSEHCCDAYLFYLQTVHSRNIFLNIYYKTSLQSSWGFQMIRLFWGKPTVTRATQSLSYAYVDWQILLQS